MIHITDEEIQEWYESARSEYDLPEYTRENYIRFTAQVYDAGFPIQHYRGRNFYEGPAVVTSDIQSVIRATDIEVQWDNMGRDWIVYPK